MISELKQIKKEELFVSVKKEKRSVWDRIISVLGYGKKR